MKFTIIKKVYHSQTQLLEPMKNNSKIQEILHYLILNAFDFLENAVEYLDKKPKDSIINLSSGTELFLKAILMFEHWSLIVLDEPNYENFINGDFKSVYLKDLPRKINNATPYKIDKEAKKCFQSIAGHRNRIIHFYHKEILESNEVLALEQLDNWWHLKGIVEGQCKMIFENYAYKLNHLESKMVEIKKYLNFKYEKIKSKITEETRLGVIFNGCPKCEYPALKKNELARNFYQNVCLICNHSEHTLDTVCSHCGTTYEINNYSIDQPYCTECGEEISLHDFFEDINENTQIHHDDDYIEINCAHCLSSESVILYQDYYICSNCLDVDTDIELCEWCNSGRLADDRLIGSYYSGCEFCGGLKAWKDH